MILMPIVYVADMDRSVEFYESLGFEVLSTSPYWSQLRAGDGAVLALHSAQSGGRVELALVAEGRLEDVQERHAAALARPIADEAFGRSLVISDPDGLRLQVNKHDRDL